MAFPCQASFFINYYTVFIFSHLPIEVRVFCPFAPVIVLPFDRAMFFGGNENSRGIVDFFDILIKLLWPYTPITMGSAGFDFPRSSSFRLKCPIFYRVRVFL